jgi:hypothetical protein
MDIISNAQCGSDYFLEADSLFADEENNSL